MVRWVFRAGTRDFFPALAALVGIVQNIFPLPYTISIYVSPSLRKLGRKSCWVACLLVYVSGCNHRVTYPIAPLLSDEAKHLLVGQRKERLRKRRMIAIVGVLAAGGGGVDPIVAP